MGDLPFRWTGSRKVACKRLAKACSADNQWLPGTVRSSKCGTISDDSGTQWLGGITEFEQYRAVVDWASRSRDAGEMLPLPKEFRQHTLRPFH